LIVAGQTGWHLKKKATRVCRSAWMHFLARGQNEDEDEDDNEHD
jgi:hypothetical protein